MLSREKFSSLQDFSNTEQTPVVSLYLNVNGAHYPSKAHYETELSSLLRQARKSAQEQLDLSRDQQNNLEEELQKISEFISLEFRRNGARGLAIFSCKPEDLWKPIPLGIPVDNRLLVDWEPKVAPLMEAVNGHDNYCVLVTNKETARIFQIYLGEISERSGIFDSVPKHHDQGGWEQNKLQRWHDLEVRGHLKRASDTTLKFFKKERFDSLLVGIADELWPDLEKVMHPYLKEKLAGRFSLDINSSPDEVLAKVSSIEEQRRQEGIESLLESLGPELEAGRSYVGGLDDVLAVLNQRRVEQLIIENGFKQPGKRCLSCNTLTFREETCPSCTSQATASADIVEEAKELAVRQDAKVTSVAPGNPSMEKAGRIAARLRY